MRLDSGDGYDPEIQGNGVFTEDPTVPEMPKWPLVSEMPEVAVVPVTPNVPDELDIIRERVLRINNTPGTPAPARSGFWRPTKAEEENN